MPDKDIRRMVNKSILGKCLVEVLFAALYLLSYIAIWVVAIVGRKQGDESVVSLAACLNMVTSITILSLIMISQRKGSDYGSSLLKGVINYIQCIVTVAVMVKCPNIIAAVIMIMIVTVGYIWWRLPELKRYVSIFRGEYRCYNATVVSNEVSDNSPRNQRTYHDVSRVAIGMFGFDVYVDLEKVDTFYYSAKHIRITYTYCVEAENDQTVYDIYEIQTDRRTFNKRLIGYRGTVVVLDSDERGEDAMML